MSEGHWRSWHAQQSHHNACEVVVRLQLGDWPQHGTHLAGAGLHRCWGKRCEICHVRRLLWPARWGSTATATRHILTSLPRGSRTASTSPWRGCKSPTWTLHNATTLNSLTLTRCGCVHLHVCRCMCWGRETVPSLNVYLDVYVVVRACIHASAMQLQSAVGALGFS